MKFCYIPWDIRLVWWLRAQVKRVVSDMNYEGRGIDPHSQHNAKISNNINISRFNSLSRNLTYEQLLSYVMLERLPTNISTFFFLLGVGWLGLGKILSLKRPTHDW